MGKSTVSEEVKSYAMEQLNTPIHPVISSMEVKNSPHKRRASFRGTVMSVYHYTPRIPITMTS